MKEVILQYLEKNQYYIRQDELKKKLKIKGEEQTESFFSALNALVEDGSLFFNDKKGYRLFKKGLGYVFGEIEINKSGNGFIHTNDGNIIFIEKQDLNGALNGDKVIIGSIDIGRRDEYKGKVNKIIKRKTGNTIFEVAVNGKETSLVPYNENETVEIIVNKNHLRNLTDGELVLIKVGTEKKENKYVAEIEKVIGHKHDPGIDLKLIYTKYNIPVEFSKEALDEANSLPNEVIAEEIKDRIDLRDKSIITIDCDSTKDRDDAVYVEKLPNGNYKLYTSIAHISHYVKKQSSLYKEASTRSTSHYPNNTCNPMFPSKLSNGICSLNQEVDRLTRTCEMEFDALGNLVDYDIYNSVIRSRKAMKYSEVNKVLDGQIIPDYGEYTEQLKQMEELCNILETARKTRNCLDFDIPDIEIIQDKQGNVERFATSGSGKAERIIENFMLATGTTIAEHYSWLPFIYRIHESPDTDVVKNVIKLLRTSGFNIPKYQNIDETVIKNIIDRVGTSEKARIVKTVLLKSMKRAKYDTNNVGHFALQLSHYCHFTSPIRRFTDFRLHMLIDELDEFDYSIESIRELEKELIEISKHASDVEKTAQEIENEALMMSMAEYMEHHIGQGYDAIITEVYQHGMFVKTDELITGKIKFENMLDDKYHYDYEKRAVIGQETKKKYQIGNKIYVIAKDASKKNRTINFETGIFKRKVLKRED